MLKQFSRKSGKSSVINVNSVNSVSGVTSLSRGVTPISDGIFPKNWAPMVQILKMIATALNIRSDTTS